MSLLRFSVFISLKNPKSKTWLIFFASILEPTEFSSLWPIEIIGFERKIASYTDTPNVNNYV